MPGKGKGGGSSNYNKNLRAEAANVYRKSTDPAGALRHRWQGPRDDQFYDAPALPAVSVYGYPIIYNFATALDVDTTNVWTEVNDNAGTGLTVQDERGGVAKFTNAAGDNDFYYYVSKYECAKVASGKDTWLRTRIKIADVDQADWFVGLCAKVSADDALFDARVDAIGFYGADGSANINVECRKNSTATADTAVGTLADATFKFLAFHIVSTETVEFFVNGTYVSTIATNLPDDEELAFAFGCRNGQASANSFSIGRTVLDMSE